MRGPALGSLSVAVLVASAPALAGCGRLGFDASGDAGAGVGDDAPRDAGGDAMTDGARPDATLANHDEDGDGVDDAVDTCPHLPAATPDGDGDGVGDACDPRPTSPTESWVRFATMRAADQPFVLAGPWTQEADAIVTSASSFTAVDDLTARTGGAHLIVGLELFGSGAAGFQQIALGGGEASSSYFVELQRTAPPGRARITFQENAAFVELQGAPLQAGLRAGTLRLQATYTTIPTPALRLEAEWPAAGELIQLSAPAPEFSGMPLGFRLGNNNVPARVHYVGVISTP